MAENQALKILIIGYGGGEITFLSRLVKGLADAGLQLTVTSPKRKNPKLLMHPNIHRLKTPPWVGPFPIRILNLIRLFITKFSFQRLGWLKNQVQNGNNQRQRLVYLNRYLPFMRGEWDVIYFPWNSAAIGYRGLYDLNIPVVVSCRGSQVNIRPYLPGQDKYVQGLKESLLRAAKVHCVSWEIQAEASQFGLDPRKSVIIHPAVDPGFFMPVKTKHSHLYFRLITTGSLIWRKGYEYLLLSIRSLIDKGVDAELDIIGGGPMRQSILFTIDDLALGDRITLHGRVPPDQVRDLLQNAEVFVISSLSEGISNAVLEAMSCGLPVVTTNCGGMAEAVSDGVEGFVVPLRDPDSFTSALTKLHADPALRDRMGIAGRDKIIKIFTLQNQVYQFKDLFMQTASLKGKE